MFMAATVKNNRINIRLSNDDKSILELAAQLNKQSLSAYIYDIAMKQAELDIKKNEKIVLADRERDILLNALDNPPLPNKALRDLFK